MLTATVIFAAAVRLVSCAPAATETIYDLGAEDCLVGRSSACLYPAAATNLPSVGGYSAPSIERIVACAPTHVLVSYLADPSLSNRLERLGISVLQFPCERLKDYAPMRARLAELCGMRPKRMLAVVQKEPLIVAGRDTLPDDILAEVGCANAVTNRTGYFVLSPEARVKLAPEGEVDFSMNYDLTRLGPNLRGEIEMLRARIKDLKATNDLKAPNDLNALKDLKGTLFRLRLWRVLAGLLVGAALALAGAVLQTVLRNPLADPFVLGLSGGASLAAAAVLATGLVAAGSFVLPAAAFAGAVLSLLFVAGMARAAGGGSVTLVLAGVVSGSLASAMLMVLLACASTRTLQSVTWWMMGSLQTAEPTSLAVAGACVGVAALAILSQSRALNALALGPDLAQALGVRPGRVLPLVLGAASLAVAAAVSLAGIIGFVGLIVPHAVRRIVGANHRALLPASAVAGGLFLVACDQLGKLFGEIEIPAGVVTALAGGPFFLWLLARRGRHA
ncbi:MAG: iron chelate uptake ABC transporter family permease subunit [Kiritimatiellae bacterium]|nr:iron chelate uptake ABC transporter family permease subunit [Kiritimatiellia bacterium]